MLLVSAKANLGIDIKRGGFKTLETALMTPAADWKVTLEKLLN